jgi:hypothetical protein
MEKNRVFFGVDHFAFENEGNLKTTTTMCLGSQRIKIGLGLLVYTAHTRIHTERNKTEALL